MAKKKTSFRSTSRRLALEPRLLFDGAGAVAAADAAQQQDAPHADTADVNRHEASQNTPPPPLGEDGRSQFSAFSAFGIQAVDAGPTVESIVRQSPTPETTNASSVTFRVTFSESVQGVTADSFVFSSSSTLAGATVQLVTAVEGSDGTQYDVLIGNLKGVGKVNIDLSENSGITSSDGNNIPVSNRNPSDTALDHSYEVDKEIALPTVGGVDVGVVGGTPPAVLTSKTSGFELHGSTSGAIVGGTGTTTGAGDRVRIFIDGTLAGTVYADGNGDWTFTYTGENLSAGGHTILVRNNDDANNTAASTYRLTVDTQAPSLSESTQSTARGTVVELNFDETLSERTEDLPEPDDFIVTVGGQNVDVSRVSVDGSIVRLNLKGTGATQGASVTVVYTGSAIKDAAGNKVAAIGTPDAPHTLNNITNSSNPAPVITGVDGTSTWFSLGDKGTLVFGQRNTLDRIALTVTDDGSADSPVESATVTIKDAKDGDQLIINESTLPKGMTVEGNGTSTLTIVGHATAAQYEALLKTVQFKATQTGTSGSVNVLPLEARHITLSVFDGQSHSDATSTTRTMYVMEKSFTSGYTPDDKDHPEKDSPLAYLVGNVVGDKTNSVTGRAELVEVNLVMGTTRVVATDIYPGIDTGGALNAAGVNPIDGHLYAWSPQDKVVVRINADGTVEKVDAGQTVSGGTALNAGSYAADISKDGVMYILNTGSTTIYRFDLNPTSANYGKWLSSISISGLPNGNNVVADIAFDNDGNLWTATANNQIKRIHLNATGDAVTSIDVYTTPSGVTFGASGNGALWGQYFDADGNFYVASGTASGGLYKINLNGMTDATGTISADRIIQLKEVQGSTLPSSGDGGRVVTIELDYGDAPDDYGTTLTNSGARHNQVNNRVWLGEEHGKEDDGQAGANADGDDSDDGVTDAFPPLNTNTPEYSLEVAVHNDSGKEAKLIGWIDFNRDGKFTADEAAEVMVENGATSAKLTWKLRDGEEPLLAVTEGDSYLRLRITSELDSLPNDAWAVGLGEYSQANSTQTTATAQRASDKRSIGARMDGEVEDYKIAIAGEDKDAPTVDIDDIDSPRSTPVGKVDITFSEGVKNVDIRDFKLTRDGVEVNMEELGLRVTGSGKNWSIDLTEATRVQGDYELSVRDDPGADKTNDITDIVGNALVNGDKTTFTIDTTAPVIDLDGDSASRDWKDTYTAGESAPISLDNSTVTKEATVTEASDALTQVTMTVSGLRDGNAEMLHLGGVDIQANGLGGDDSHGSYEVTVDGVTVDIVYDKNNATFTFTKSDGTDFTQAQAQAIVRGLTYSNDSVTDSNGNSLATNGDRSFSFSATDKAGVTATAAVSRITVEGGTGKNPLDTPTVVPQHTKDVTPEITGSANVPEGGKLTVEIEGRTYIWEDGKGETQNGLTYNDTDKTWTLKIPETDPLDEKTYDVDATVTDQDGNDSKDVTKGELIIDLTPPATPVVPDQSTHDTTPVIKGTATVLDGEALTVSVVVGDKTYTYTEGTTEGDKYLKRTNNSWSLSLPPEDAAKMVPGQSYDVTATVKDEAGNVSETGTGTVTIKPVTVSSPTVNEASGHAVFTVDVLPNTSVKLALQDGDGQGGSAATGKGTDYGTATGTGLEYWNGSAWVAYTAGAAVPADGTGKLLVRTPIINDDIADNGEKFQLVATPVYAGNEAITDNTGTGTATIKDDGTGDIFTPDGTPQSGQPGDPGYITPNNDYALTITSPTVNEASPYAVFEVTGQQGNKITLTLTPDSATGGGVDYGSNGGSKPNLEYSVDGGKTWTGYTSDSGVEIDVPEGGKVLVRTPIVQDDIAEGSETFKLIATPSTGADDAVTGIGTIVDDGTGDIFTPGGSIDPNAPKDNDHTLTIDNPTVNEASPYAVFTVTGKQGKEITLMLTPDSAKDGGVDYGTDGTDSSKPNLEYSTDGGKTWVPYTDGAKVTVPEGGKVLVRTPIVQDDIAEGSETFKLIATPSTGADDAVTGIGTIVDDGTGTIWVPTNPNNPNGPLTPLEPGQTPPAGVTPPVFDDDRTVTVGDITVNEGAGKAVFTVGGAAGQKVKLELADGTGSDKATGGGVDYGPALEYFDGTAWKSYTPGTYVDIPAGGKLQVRTPIVNDDLTEGSEKFTLKATNTGGTSATGTGTIVDDGTGTIWVPTDPDKPNGELTPLEPGQTPPTGVTPPVFDDDRTVTVGDIDVNEASSHGVFTVEGAKGQKVTLSLGDGTATGGGVDFGSKDANNLQYSTDGGKSWHNYTAGGEVDITNADGTLLVRTPIVQDDITEISENFTLTVGVAGGKTATGTATIHDDGTGDIWVPENPPATPGGPVDPNGPIKPNPEPGEPGHITPDVDNRNPEAPEKVKTTTPEDTPVKGRVPGTDPDGDPLTYEVPNQPEHGTVTITPEGEFTYTPDPDYHGGPDTFEVVVTDGKGGKTTTTVTVDVTPVNDAPMVPDYTKTTPEDTPVSGQVTGTDVDGDKLTYSKGSDPRHGTVTVQPDGSYTYTPNPNFSGQDSFTVEVSDGKGGWTTSTVTVDVTPVNDPPTVPNYDLPTREDTPVSGKVTGTDVDGDPLTYTEGQPPTKGTVTIDPDTGEFTYTPDPGQNGTDTFTVIVTDGNGGTTTSTVTVDINGRPTAPPVKTTTPEDTPVSGNVPGSDVDGDPLTYTKGSDPTHGTVTITPDGGYTYVPEPDYYGPDTFEVIVTDGQGNTTTTTVTVDVTPVNDVPTAPNYHETTPEDTPLKGKVDGSDVDGDPLKYTVPTQPEHGTVTIDPDTGEYTYTPDPNFNGGDTFTVIVTDPDGGTTTSTVTVNVTPENDAPEAPDYPETTPEDTPLVGKVVGSDPDGDPLTYSKGSDPKHGTVTVNPDGGYIYVPEPNFNGKDSFTVTVSDGQGGTTTSTVTVDVTPVNDAPKAPPVYLETDQGDPVPGQVEGSDPDGDPLTYELGDPPKHGEVTVKPDGSFEYTPYPPYTDQDTFTVIVTDGNGGKTTTTVHVNVKPVPHDPTVGPYTEETPEDTPLEGKVVGSDVDGDPLTYTKGSDPQHGTVTVNPDGGYIYVPEPNFNGKDSFTVTVSDGQGGTTTSTVTVDVTPVNDNPVAPPVRVTTPEDTPVTGMVPGSDPDGDTLEYTPGPKGPEHGTVTITPDGKFTYTPDPDYHGPDTFEVVVEDPHGGKTTTTVTVIVTPENDAPKVPDVKVTTPEDTPVKGQIPGTDPDGDPLTYGPGPKGPEHGTVTITPDGGYTYVPEPGYHGPDTFEVVVEDPHGGKTTTTVTVDVDGKPTAPPTSVTTDPGVPVVGKVTGSDPDGDPLTYTVPTQPEHGTVTIDPSTGEFTYTPKPGYDGPDTFNVIVDDGRGGKTTTTVTVTVRPPVNSSQGGRSLPPPFLPPESDAGPSAPDPTGKKSSAGTADVSGTPGVFFYWNDQNRVARMDGPLHPTVFVAPAVSDSQAEQAQAQMLGSDVGLNEPGQVRAGTIGARLGQDPTLYVQHAVRGAQQEGSLWERMARKLKGNLSPQAPEITPNVASDAGIPESLQAVPPSVPGAPAAQPQTDADTGAGADPKANAAAEAQEAEALQTQAALLQRWVQEAEQPVAEAARQQHAGGSFHQQLQAQARKLPSRVS